MDEEAALLAAYGALRAGDAAGALAALDGVKPTTPANQARVAAWRAQALRTLGRVDDAERAVAEAVRLAKAAGDVDGVKQLRELQASILASLAATRTAESERAKDAALADTAMLALLSGAADGAERAARLVRKAGALLDGGRRDEARRVACIAVDEARAADAPRERVLALLALARIDPDHAAARILDAHAVADAANDENLVTAVAHAARAAGVRLPPPEFG